MTQSPAPTGDGWQIKKAPNEPSNWVALYTPDVANLDHTLPAKQVYETHQEAVDYALANYTANGIVWDEGANS